MSTKKPLGAVTITTLISLSIAIFVGFFFSLFIKFEDLNQSADVRNVLLSIVASAGIPFVILSHRIKSKDLLLKVETEKLKLLIDQLILDLNELTNLSNTNVHDTLNQKYNYYEGIRLILETNTPGIDTIHTLIDQEDWARVELLSKSIKMVLKSAKDFKNYDYQQLIVRRFFTLADSSLLKLIAAADATYTISNSNQPVVSNKYLIEYFDELNQDGDIDEDDLSNLKVLNQKILNEKIKSNQIKRTVKSILGS